MKKVHQEARIENVYQLEGRVPVGKAIPFGLQHVLAMFVANIAPLIIIASVAVYNGQVFTTIETAQLLHRHADPALSDLEDRLGSAGCHGTELHVPRGLHVRRVAGLRHHGRVNHRRRYF